MGLEKDILDFGRGLMDAFLQTPQQRLYFVCFQVVLDIDLTGDEDTIRSQLHREQCDHGFDLGELRDRAAYRLLRSLRRGRAEQQVTSLPAKHDRHINEHDTDQDRRDRIEDGIAGDLEQEETGRRNDDTDSRRHILVQRRLECDVAGFSEKLAYPNTQLPGLMPGFAQRQDEHYAVEDKGNSKHEVARPKRSVVLPPVHQLLDALIDREEGAGDEDEYGGQERPKETLLAVTVGVILVGRVVAQADADEEEALVYRV